MNQAIKLYEQLEVIPIYQTFVMLAWIGAGLLVFGEYKLYETHQLIGFAISIVMCLLGVKFLTMKRRGSALESKSSLRSPQSLSSKHE